MMNEQSISTTPRRSYRLVALAAGAVMAIGGVVAHPSTAAGGTEKASGSASFGKYKCKRVTGGNDYIKSNCKVTDKAKDGKGVYLQVKGVRDWDFDSPWVRHTDNVDPGYPETDHFKVTQSAQLGGIDNWLIRVCKEVNNEDDPCSESDYIDV